MLDGAPPSLVQRLLRKGKVRINGQKARVGDRLEIGDEVVVHHVARGGAGRSSNNRAGRSSDDGVGRSSNSGVELRPGEEATGDSADRHDPSLPIPYDGPPLSVLHRDLAFMVVNKPAGLSCQPTQLAESSVLGWAQLELADAIAAGEARPDLAHRIDRGTTGAVAVALTAAATERFRLALGAERVEKRYLVLVWGRPESEHFELDQPLLRKPHAPRNRPKVVVASDSAGALPALTRFQWLAAGPESSLLAATLVTGRTHQIRAHLHAAGLPVVGDPRYGDRRRDRNAGLAAWLDHQLLHSQRLAFEDDRGGFAVVAALPPEMERAARHLKIDFPASI